MKKKRLVISLIVIFVFIFLFFIFRPDKKGPMTVKATVGTFIVDLDVTGELIAEKSISVTAPDVRTSLRVTKLIKDGTFVQEGDILARFDPSELQKDLDSSEADLKTIDAQIQQKEASLEALRRRYFMELEDVRMSFDMAKLDMVNEEGLLPAKEVEKAKLRLENARTKLLETEKKLLDEEKASLAELEVLHVQRRNKIQNLEHARRSYENMTVRAPASGLVVLREIWKGGTMGKVQEGDTLWRGSSFIQLPDLTTLQVQGWLSEVDVGRVKPGQKAKIILDAFPRETFNGEVLNVASVGVQRDYEVAKKTFEVLISLNPIDEKMKPGMTVRATIMINTFDNAVYIPIEALFTDGEGESTVYVKHGGSRREVRVRTGDRNATHCQILEGLSGGEDLFISVEKEA